MEKNVFNFVINWGGGQFSIHIFTGLRNWFFSNYLGASLHLFIFFVLKLGIPWHFYKWIILTIYTYCVGWGLIT